MSRLAIRDMRPEERTLPRLLQRQADRYPDKPFIETPRGSVSYAGLLEATSRLAGTLRAAGVGAGDRVVTLCGNRLELAELLFACAWLGAILAPLNPALRGQPLEHQLRDSDPRLVLDEASLDQLSPGAAIAAVDGKPQDICAILYTSGTTGLPKGVCCPQEQLFWYAVHTAEHLAVTESDRLFTCLPLFHINALNTLIQALVAGATCILGKRFSASRYWRQAADARATVTFLLGGMAQMLWKQPAQEDDRAHSVRIALAPAAPGALLEPFAQRFGVWLLDGFGMTENSLVISAPANEQQPGRMGRIVEGFEASVVDPDDRPVPDGTPGELIVRHAKPHSVAAGYWRNPEATVAAWRNLWFHTGDRVIRHPDGYFSYVDRMKDAIRRRGENVSSLEVEQALAEHPAVLETAAVGVPDPISEEEVKACVVLRPGAEVSPLELVQWCEPRLPYFAVPRYIELLPELPRTPSGKLQKFALRERGVTPQTFDREAAGYQVQR